MRFQLLLSFTFAASLAWAEEKPLSFFNDVVPIFKKSCNAAIIRAS